MYGDQTLATIGGHVMPVNGNLPTEAGCGFPTSLTDGSFIITVTGRLQMQPDGYGFPVMIGHHRALDGLRGMILSAGRRFLPPDGIFQIFMMTTEEDFG